MFECIFVCDLHLSLLGLQVDWMPELHKKFVQAVEQLGVDQAIPSRILELMKVEGLTRHNVASHLQVSRKLARLKLHKIHSVCFKTFEIGFGQNDGNGYPSQNSEPCYDVLIESLF